MWRRLLIGLIDAVGLGHKPTKAVPFTHPRYGHFGVTEDSLGRIHDDVSIGWLCEEISLSAFAQGGQIVEASFTTIDALLADQAGWQDRVVEPMLAEMYPLWVEEWRDSEFQPMLDESEFLKQLRLVSISLGSDDRFEFWFDPNELFHGHVIEVRCSLSEGVREVCLMG